MNNLSEYELLRLDNIKRNREYLEKLGLSIDENLKPEKNLINNKRKTKTESIVSSLEDQIVRRSRRLSNNNIEDHEISVNNGDDDIYFVETVKTKMRRIELVVGIDEEETGRTKITSQTVRNFIVETNEQHAEEISDEVFFIFVFLTIYSI